MKIAYGTYAMPTLPLEKAIPSLSSIGCDGVEIYLSPDHAGSMPDQIDAARRITLNRLLRQHGMEVPALMLSRLVFQEDDAAHQDNLEHLREVVQLARDLEIGDEPVLAIPLGGGLSDQWEEQRHRLAEQLGDYGELGDQEGFVVAGELHCGNIVDDSERSLWLFNQVGRDNVGLHFDVVHTFIAGEAVEDSVRDLVPITKHTHVTDARQRNDGEYDLDVLGKGDLDTVAYVKAMHQAGWDDFITLEVSARIWRQKEYDPEEAARFSYATLSGAFEAAGVPRG